MEMPDRGADRPALNGCFRRSLTDVRLIDTLREPSARLLMCEGPFLFFFVIVLLPKASPGLLCNHHQSPAGLTGPGLCCLVWTRQGEGSTAPVLFQPKLESPNQMGLVESTQRPPWKIRASVQRNPPVVDRYGRVRMNSKSPFDVHFMASV